MSVSPIDLFFYPGQVYWDSCGLLHHLELSLGLEFQRFGASSMTGQARAIAVAAASRNSHGADTNSLAAATGLYGHTYLCPPLPLPPQCLPLSLHLLSQVLSPSDIPDALRFAAGSGRALEY